MQAILFASKFVAANGHDILHFYVHVLRSMLYIILGLVIDCELAQKQHCSKC